MLADIALLLASLGLGSACVQFRRLSLSEAVVASVRPLAYIERVSGSSSCAQLCLREPHCAAIRYHRALAKCDLLTARFDLLEGPRAVADVRGFVEVLAIQSRGFGECPSSYTAAWRSSRYRWSRERKSWSEAVKACEKEGGKLAELTSEEEVKAVFDELEISYDYYFFDIGGLQTPGAEEPSGGWHFLRSQLPVNMSLFREGQLDNWRGKENHLSAKKRSNKVYYNDISMASGHDFICECTRID